MSDDPPPRKRNKKKKYNANVCFSTFSIQILADQIQNLKKWPFALPKMAKEKQLLLMI